MNKLLIKIAVIFLIIGSTYAQGQSSDSDLELMQKYWNYRDNFRKSYIKIGPRQGESLPAVSIDNSIKGGDGIWYGAVLETDSMKISANRTTYNAGHKGPEYWNRKTFADVLAWEDCHLGVLATEYWLLTQSAAKDLESINAVKNELYFAIMAVDRLDERAESYYNRDFTGNSKNGFFIRSDNAPDYLKYFRNQQIPFQPIQNLASGGATRHLFVQI